jgi:hypothetical protein
MQNSRCLDTCLPCFLMKNETREKGEEEERDGDDDGDDDFLN